MYELTHHMHTKKGREGLVGIKLDMSKAYDRFEWDILRNVMLKVGFDPRWVERVML